MISFHVMKFFIVVYIRCYRQAAVNQEASSDNPSHENLIHFVGASPGSGQLCNLLQRICWTIKLTFNLIMGVPDDYQ